MTYTPPVIAPPAAAPWDLAAVTASALAVLGLDPTDPDAEAVGQAAGVATVRIDQGLDYPAPPWATAADIPSPVVSAAVTLTVEVYRRKDAPFGVTDAWSVDGAVLRLSPDVLRGVDTMIAPWRARRGVA